MRAWIVAMECEADAVRPALKQDDRLYLSGIGKVNAAMATQQAIDEGATEIVNAGLAGGLVPTMNIADVVEIGAAIEYDFNLDDINHRGIGVLDEREETEIPVSGADKNAARLYTLATGDRFTNDETDIMLVRELGGEVRDMEGAAIAHVCEKRKVKCRMIKAISDVAGRGGMVEQYLAKKERALKALGDALVNLDQP